MADVKQAAKWMQEGKGVTRPVSEFIADSGKRIRFVMTDLGFVECRDCCKDHEQKPMLVADDLLADDWEIAE